MRKIGIFGSSFNPIHIGHLIIAEQARIRLNLEKIIFIPTFNPYHKTVDLLNYDIRYNMVEEVIEDNRYFEISDIERNLQKKSYSFDVVNMLKEEEDANYYFIIGSDSFLQLDTWYNYKKLLNLVNFVIFERPEYIVDEQLLKEYRKISNNEIYYFKDLQIQISSSMIRKSIKKSIYPKYILTDKTINFIRENKLWQ